MITEYVVNRQHVKYIYEINSYVLLAFNTMT